MLTVDLDIETIEIETPKPQAVQPSVKPVEVKTTDEKPLSRAEQLKRKYNGR